jgi:hypothetical protein
VLRQAGYVVRNTMLTLPTNSMNLIARCFSFVLVTGIGYVFLMHALSDNNAQHIIFLRIKEIHIAYLFVAVLSFIAMILIASIFSIVKVNVDITVDEITLITFLSKRTLAVSDITTYFKATHRNQFKEWQGIILETKNNGTIQLAGQNLKSLRDFEKYLIDKGISCSGQRRMKFPFN